MTLYCTKLLLISHSICVALSAPQQPEINDQFTKVMPPIEETVKKEEDTNKVDNLVDPTFIESVNHDSQVKANQKESRKYFVIDNKVKEVETKFSYIDTVYEILTRPISKFFSSPKVTFVLRNVGTCLVNGVMEIISHFLPAPFIPLIASAAGMVIPFEPVVMLKEKMPVTSYRRAFRKAMNSFLNTFEGYKFDSYDDDPYMTRRFNRRFMNDISGEKKEKI